MTVLVCPPPKLAPGAGFSVRAYVSPNPVPYGAQPTLYARTSPGAVCLASVVYATGHAPRSFDGSAQTVRSSGDFSRCASWDGTGSRMVSLG